MPATYEPIATTTLGSAAARITFSSIGAGYTDLRLILTTFRSGASNDYTLLTLNNDTSALYSLTQIFGDGATVTSSRQTAQTSLAGPSTKATPCLGIFDFFNYAGSTNKTFLANISEDANGSGVSWRYVALYRSTSAVNRIDIIGGGANLGIGTTATLYGILRA